MEANAAKQQTLAEFMAPKKSLRIWQIILAALLSLMILGAVYEFTKPKPGPVQMSTALESSTYSYVDITLLSPWLLKVTGDHEYTLYEAMDAEGNWFLLTLDDSKAAELSAPSWQTTQTSCCASLRGTSRMEAFVRGPAAEEDPASGS